MILLYQRKRAPSSYGLNPFVRAQIIDEIYHSKIGPGAHFFAKMESWKKMY